MTTPRPRPRGSVEDSPQITNEKVLPLVAPGPLAENSDEFNEVAYRNRVQGSTYELDWRGLSRLDGDNETQIDVANTEASHFSGMAYNSGRNQLAICSHGGEGYFDFYNVDTQEWSSPVSLQHKDIMGLFYWPERDELYALEDDHSEHRSVSKLLVFSHDGQYLRSVELSFSVILADPRMRVQGERLVLFSAMSPELSSYVVDADTGQVSGHFREGYDGERAALIAVYEASGDHDRLGTMNVTVQETAPPVLVLNSYEGVNWQISGGTHLKRVIVSGYETPKVSGIPNGCELTIMSYESDGEYLPCAHAVQSSDMALLLSKLEGMAIGVESIAAAYQANQALIR
jgi:hypothetical protein